VEQILKDEAMACNGMHYWCVCNTYLHATKLIARTAFRGAMDETRNGHEFSLVLLVQIRDSTR